MNSRFGGRWTEEKLDLVQKYLTAYSKIMNKRQYKFAYIDAFAGTGYREVADLLFDCPQMFPEMRGKETQRFLEGSTRRALQVKPIFNKYIFIELSKGKAEQLAKLRDEYPHLKDRIEVVNDNCNSWLQDRCANYNWQQHRAVLFLDPYGMQVKWETMISIAKTKAVDVLILFPLGIAINRLLRRDSRINENIRGCINSLFGTAEWYEEFYQESYQRGLFSQEKRKEKVVNLESISRYYVKRLKTIFPTEGVADITKPLLNSKGNPLFHLCFATGNLFAARTAVKIATDIFK